MVKVFLILLLLTTLVVYINGGCPATWQCGENEKFTKCGTSCEPSCENPDPQICTDECRIGCECKPGYLRNNQGQCVTHCACKKQQKNNNRHNHRNNNRNHDHNDRNSDNRNNHRNRRDNRHGHN